MEQQKREKELRKNFMYDGPIRVLQRLMVDPKGVIKKSGGKDLPVCQGEVLDAIQFTNSKKVLCRNRFGKCMEGEIYDDVDHSNGEFSLTHVQ
uniref:Helically-extended SH3 domain-containing protein n=1 Tax=Cynoglossus semilaevis TaxID=244447 RepID=A0A3P8WME1_CYNSE